MKAVVTGASSMIASALIRLLIAEGHEVYALCRPGSKKLGNIIKNERVHIVHSDISDITAVGQSIGCGCDAFFHFAWGGTSGAQRNDSRIQSENIRFTLDAVELAHSLGCEVFIGAGSQAEYGRVDGKIAPHTPCFPENAYGAAKLAAGHLSRIACAKHGIRHVWARILSVYGIGDNDFTITVSSLKKMLSGQVAQFTPAEQMWDFLYCDDAARAFHLMAKFGKDGAVYTLGSGQARPLKDYIKLMHAASGADSEVQIGALPYNDKQVMYLCADISALTADTGFVPQVSYEEGIKETVKWLKGSE
ncbi:MAG: NAD(P)-dependent oxidoreductase [Clostridia bacterium]|nr:NAD(P)-dependent oxidoreductase [Clostridia bacterium]